MNVRLQFNTDFRAASWFGDELIINSFSVSLQMLTQSKDPNDHPICMGRIRAVLDQLEHSVFIDQSNTDKIKELTACGIRVVTFPKDPTDQIVGIVLFEKLNAVLENRMCVTNFDICSELGDNIWFMHNDNERVYAIPRAGWWTDPAPGCVSNPLPNHEKKVVKLKRQLTWKTLDLEWQPQDPTETVIINIKDDK
jgi:hypothetical protein